MISGTLDFLAFATYLYTTTGRWGRLKGALNAAECSVCGPG